jgi:hypothetical protein
MLQLDTDFECLRERAPSQQAKNRHQQQKNKETTDRIKPNSQKTQRSYNETKRETFAAT